jgi:hypothetical protein
MARREFEEILEECLSALLEGRRSVGESLSLYPAWRSRLEPLLRAAEEMAPAFGQSPPPHARQRGLQRFLEAARTRRRLRKIFPPQAEGVPWWRWAPAGVAVVVVIGAMSFLSASLMAEEGRRLDDPISIRSYVPTPERTAPPASVPSPLERVQEQVVVLEEAVRQGETVEVEFLGELEEASSELAQSLGDPGEVELVDRMAAVSAASKEYELLQTVQEQSSGFEARVLEASLAAAEDVLEKLGATPEPEPTVSPEPTTSPEPTSSPAATPSAVPSLTPTADAQATPSPLPTQASVD